MPHFVLVPKLRDGLHALLGSAGRANTTATPPAMVFATEHAEASRTHLARTDDVVWEPRRRQPIQFLHQHLGSVATWLRGVSHSHTHWQHGTSQHVLGLLAQQAEVIGFTLLGLWRWLAGTRFSPSQRIVTGIVRIVVAVSTGTSTGTSTCPGLLSSASFVRGLGCRGFGFGCQDFRVALAAIALHLLPHIIDVTRYSTHSHTKHTHTEHTPFSGCPALPLPAGPSWIASSACRVRNPAQQRRWLDAARRRQQPLGPHPIAVTAACYDNRPRTDSIQSKAAAAGAHTCFNAAISLSLAASAWSLAANACSVERTRDVSA